MDGPVVALLGFNGEQAAAAYADAEAAGQPEIYCSSMESTMDCYRLSVKDRLEGYDNLSAKDFIDLRGEDGGTSEVPRRRKSESKSVHLKPQHKLFLLLSWDILSRSGAIAAAISLYLRILGELSERAAIGLNSRESAIAERYRSSSFLIHSGVSPALALILDEDRMGEGEAVACNLKVSLCDHLPFWIEGGTPEAMECLQAIFDRLGSIYSCLLEGHKSRAEGAQRVNDNLVRVLSFVEGVAMRSAQLSQDGARLPICQGGPIVPLVVRILAVVLRPFSSVVSMTSKRVIERGGTTALNQLNKNVQDGARAVYNVLRKVTVSYPILARPPRVSMEAACELAQEKVSVEDAEMASDVVLTFVCRALLLVPDRRDWRETAAKMLLEFATNLPADDVGEEHFDPLPEADLDSGGPWPDTEEFPAGLSLFLRNSSLSQIMCRAAIANAIKFKNTTDPSPETGEEAVEAVGEKLLAVMTAKTTQRIVLAWTLRFQGETFISRLLAWVAVLYHGPKAAHRAMAIEITTSVLLGVDIRTKSERVLEQYLSTMNEGISAGNDVVENVSRSISQGGMALGLLADLAAETKSTSAPVRAKAVDGLSTMIAALAKDPSSPRLLSMLLTNCADHIGAARPLHPFPERPPAPVDVWTILVERMADMKLLVIKSSLELLGSCSKGLAALRTTGCGAESRSVIDECDIRIPGCHFASRLRAAASHSSVQLRSKAVAVVHQLLLDHHDAPAVRRLWGEIVLVASCDTEQSVQEMCKKNVSVSWLSQGLKNELEASVRRFQRNEAVAAATFPHIATLAALTVSDWDYLLKAVLLWIRAPDTQRSSVLEMINILGEATCLWTQGCIRSRDEETFMIIAEGMRGITRLFNLFVTNSLPALADPKCKRAARGREKNDEALETAMWPVESIKLASTLCDRVFALWELLQDPKPHWLVDECSSSLSLVRGVVTCLRTILLRISACCAHSPKAPVDRLYAIAEGTLLVNESDGIDAALRRPCAEELRVALLLWRNSAEPTRWQQNRDLLLVRLQALARNLTSLTKEDFSLFLSTGGDFVTAQLSLMGDLLAHSGDVKPASKNVKDIISVIGAIATGTLGHVVVAGDAAVSSALRGVAVAGLAKACMAWDSVGRAKINVLVTLLKDQDVVVRSNALVGLGDICINCSNLVDHHFLAILELLVEGDLTPEPLVRRQALATVSSLLANDYMKLRDEVFLRTLIPLADSHRSVSELASSVFHRVILQKQPEIVSTNFGHMICALNGFYSHPTFQMTWAIRGTRQQTTRHVAFSLARQPHKRYKIYIEVTSQLNGSARLQAVLALIAFLDSFLETSSSRVIKLPVGIEHPIGAALFDCLRLIGSNLLEFQSGESPDVVQGDDEGRGDELRSLVKQTLKDTVVPTLLTFKNRLEADRSTFQPELRICLHSLLWPYRDNLDFMLEHDAVFRKQVRLEFERNAVLYLDRGLSLERGIGLSRFPGFGGSMTVARTADMRAAVTAGRVGVTAPKVKLPLVARRNSDVVNATPTRHKDRWHDQLTKEGAGDLNLKDEAENEFIGTPLKIQEGTPMRTNTPQRQTPARQSI